MRDFGFSYNLQAPNEHSIILISGIFSGSSTISSSINSISSSRSISIT